tara:strand:+ start:617 stop:952 length:336 start_codon:yes stop_codon:yes gene_type:complete
MKAISTLVLILSFILIAEQSSYAQSHYAYVSVNGKLFSKKLKVDVDFGDEPEQVAKGEEFSEVLNNKKSFASILNYMVANGYELVETLDVIHMQQGNGGTQGIRFIMKKTD